MGISRRERRRLKKLERRAAEEQESSRERNRSLRKWVAYTMVAVLALAGMTAGLSYYTGYVTQQPGPYDDFAACLTEKGATVYGAYWCPNCQRQKLNFGNSFRLINYVECDPNDPEGKGQPTLCEAEGITAYPTWVYQGQKHVGLKSMEELSGMTGCEI